jgi:hypothetical protein
MIVTKIVIDSATRTATITSTWYGIKKVTYDVNETKTWNVTWNATWIATENVTRNAIDATKNALKFEMNKL